MANENIYCPKCGRKVLTYDGKSKITKDVVCKKCNKLAVFNPENRTVVLQELPNRTTSSGARFY